MANNLLVDWLNKKPNLQKSVQSTVNNNTASNVRNVTTPELKTGGINLQKAAIPTNSNIGAGSVAPLQVNGKPQLQVNAPLSTTNVKSTIQSNNPAFANGGLITPQNQPSRFIGMQQPQPAVLETTPNERQGLNWQTMMNGGYAYVPSELSKANAANLGEETRFRNMSNAFYDLQAEIWKKGKILSDYELNNLFPEFKDMDKDVLKELQNELLPIVQSGKGVDAEQLSQLYPELLKGKELKDIEEIKKKTEEGNKRFEQLSKVVDIAKGDVEGMSSNGVQSIQDAKTIWQMVQAVKKGGVVGGGSDYEILQKLYENNDEVKKLVDDFNSLELTEKDKAIWGAEDASNIRKLFHNITSPLRKDDEFMKTGEELESLKNKTKAMEDDYWGQVGGTAKVGLRASADTFEKFIYRMGKDAKLWTIDDIDEYLAQSERNEMDVKEYNKAVNAETEKIANDRIDPDVRNYYNNHTMSRSIALGDIPGFFLQSTKAATENIDMPIIIAAGVVAPEIVLPLMATDTYVRESEGAFEELLENGASYDDAEQGAVMVGLANTAIELWLEKLLGGVETTASREIRNALMKDISSKIPDMVAKRGLVDLAKQGLTTQLRSSFEEGLEEIFQESIQNYAVSKYNPDVKITDGLRQAFEGGFFNPMNLLAGGGDILSNIDVNALNESAYNAGVRTREIVDSAKESLNQGAFNAGAFLGNMTEDFKNSFTQGGTNNTEISQQQGGVNTTSENQNNINGANYNQNVKNDKTLNKVQLGMLQNDNRMNPSKITEFKEKFGEDYGQALADRGYTESWETNVPKIEEDTKDIYNKKKEAMNSVQGEFKDRSLRDMINLMLKKAKNTLDYDMIDKYNALKQKHNSRGLTMEEANDMREEYSYKIQTKWHKDNNSDKIDLADNVYMAVKNFLEKTAEQNGIKDLKQMNREIAMRKFLSTWIGDKAEKQSANNMVSLTDWVILAEAVSNPYAAAGFAAKKIAQRPKVKNAVLNVAVGRRQNRAIDTQNRQVANQQRMESIERANEGKQLQQQLSKPETPALPNGIKLTKVTEIDARKKTKPKNKITNKNKKSDSSSSDDGGTPPPSGGTPTNTNPSNTNPTTKGEDNTKKEEKKSEPKKKNEVTTKKAEVAPQVEEVEEVGKETGNKTINGNEIEKIINKVEDTGDFSLLSNIFEKVTPSEGESYWYGVFFPNSRVVTKDGVFEYSVPLRVWETDDSVYLRYGKKGEQRVPSDIAGKGTLIKIGKDGWQGKNFANCIRELRIGGSVKSTLEEQNVDVVTASNKSEVATEKPKNAVTAKKTVDSTKKDNRFRFTKEDARGFTEEELKEYQEGKGFDESELSEEEKKTYNLIKNNGFTVVEHIYNPDAATELGTNIYILRNDNTGNNYIIFASDGLLYDDTITIQYNPQMGRTVKGKDVGKVLEEINNLTQDVEAQPKNGVTKKPAAKKKTAVEKFREETAKYEPDYEMIESGARDLAQQILTDAGVDAEIVDLVFTGSNSRGLAHDTSDNDILIEIKPRNGAELREDSLFELLNDEEWNDGEYDFNPILADKSGTLEQVVKEQEKYMKNKRVIKDIADEFGIKWDKELADDAGNMHGDLIKEFLDKTEGPIEVRNSGDGEVAGALDTELYKKNPQNLSNTFYIGGNKKDMDFIKKIKRPETENSKAYSKLFEQYSQPKNKVTSKKSEVTAPKETKVETKTEEKSDLRSKLGDKFYEYMEKQVELTNKTRKGNNGLTGEPLNLKEVTMEELLPQYIDQFEEIAQKEVKEIQAELNELTKDRPEAKMTDAQRKQLNGITDQNERNKLLKKWQDEWIKSHPISDEDAAKVGELMERAAEVVEGHKKARNYLYELEEAQENKENEDHFSYDTYGDIQKRIEEAENKINEEFDKKFEEEYDKKKARFDELNAKDNTDRSDGSEIAKLANDLNNMRNKYDKLKEDAFNKRYPDLVAEKAKQEELFNKDWKKTYRRAVWNLENGNTAKNKVTNNAKNKVTNITVTQGQGKKVDNSSITGRFRNLTLDEYNDMKEMGGLEELYVDGKLEEIVGMRDLEELVNAMYDLTEYGLPEDFHIDYHDWSARENGQHIIEIQQLLEKIDNGEDTKAYEDVYGDHMIEKKDGTYEWDVQELKDLQYDYICDMLDNAYDNLYNEEKEVDRGFAQKIQENLAGLEISKWDREKHGLLFNGMKELRRKYGDYWKQGDSNDRWNNFVKNATDIDNLDNNETPQIPTIFEEDLEEMNLRQLDENETPQMVEEELKRISEGESEEVSPEIQVKEKGLTDEENAQYSKIKNYYQTLIDEDNEKIKRRQANPTPDNDAHIKIIQDRINAYEEALALGEDLVKIDNLGQELGNKISENLKGQKRGGTKYFPTKESKFIENKDGSKLKYITTTRGDTSLQGGIIEVVNPKGSKETFVVQKIGESPREVRAGGKYLNLEAVQNLVDITNGEYKAFNKNEGTENYEVKNKPSESPKEQFIEIEEGKRGATREQIENELNKVEKWEDPITGAKYRGTKAQHMQYFVDTPIWKLEQDDTYSARRYATANTFDGYTQHFLYGIEWDYAKFLEANPDIRDTPIKPVTLKQQVEDMAREDGVEMPKEGEEIKYERLPENISVKEEAKKTGLKRIAPDRVIWQQETFDEGLDKVYDAIKDLSHALEENDNYNDYIKKARQEGRYNVSEFKTSDGKTIYDMWKLQAKAVSDLGFRSTNSNEYVKLVKDVKDAKGNAASLRAIANTLYIKRVSDDIGKHYIYPEEVYKGKPDLLKARDKFEAYLKGYNTSFSSTDSRIDYSMKDTLGAGVKRQDGKQITQAQKDWILANALNYGRVLNLDIKKLFEDLGITVVHLNGKNPFLTKGALGVFHPKTKSISVGNGEEKYSIGKGDKKQTKSVTTTFGHELTHAIDHMEDWELFTDGQVQGLKYTFNPVVSDRASDYWTSKAEVTARMVEQYLGIEGLGRREYFNKGGYWKEDIYNSLIKPVVERTFKEKLADYRREGGTPIPEGFDIDALIDDAAYEKPMNSITASDLNRVTNR